MENSTMRLIDKYSGPGDIILDVGVGLGCLLSTCHLYDAMEWTLALVILVAQSQGVDVCYALVEEMPYQANLFDIIVWYVQMC
jgi:hypothetical protein